MNWDDKGFLISKIKYNENSVIADLYTENHGRVAGIIFGATSKKTKGYLQIGNFFHINCNFKSETKIGSFKVEIINPYTPYYFSNINKLHCITSAMSMIKLLTAENQTNKNIFTLIIDFFDLLEDRDWEKKYLFWELELLKLSGYDLNLEKIVQKTIKDNKIEYFVQSSTEKKNIPSFFIDKKINNLEKSELIKGYNLITNYLEKNILNPNNLNHPNSRLDFINLLR